MCVALRKESVDRNLPKRRRRPPAKVALRKESVDRNVYSRDHVVSELRSLSARRAWIEILPAFVFASFPRSLSARRAWIEIMAEQ